MSRRNGYALDLFTPVRHVATKLEGAAPAALSFDEIAAGYEHTIPSDLFRVQLHEKVDGKREAVRWIIRKALDEINAEEIDGRFQFPDGVRLENLRYHDRVVHPLLPDPPTVFNDPFNPLVADNLSDNVRVHTGKDSMSELRESMRRFGWLPYHPAVMDERGVVLVGHRRLKVAEDLNAEGVEPPIVPQIVTHVYGRGESADIERFKLAIGSNLGAKSFNDGDWKKIAASMRSEGWTLQAIADALDKAETTVRRNLTTTAIAADVVTPDRRRARTPEKDLITREMTDQGYSRDKIMEATGYGSSTVDRVRAEMRGARQAQAGASVTSVTPPPAEKAPSPEPAVSKTPVSETATTCECPNCGHHHQVQP